MSEASVDGDVAVIERFYEALGVDPENVDVVPDEDADGTVIRYFLRPRKETPRDQLVTFFENLEPTRNGGAEVWVYPDRLDRLVTLTEAHSE